MLMVGNGNRGKATACKLKNVALLSAQAQLVCDILLSFNKINFYQLLPIQCVKKRGTELEMRGFNTVQNWSQAVNLGINACFNCYKYE